ncbi:hypothetical protein VUR80DRAFT_3702 [Thermomyces stellatus]
MTRGPVTTCLLLLQAALTTAIIIPADLPEGLYTIPLDASSAPTRIDTRSPTRRQARWQADCGVDGPININDFTVAKENLQDGCDRGETYIPHSAVVYTTGSAIAYFCNYGRRNQCSRAEYDEAMLSLVQQCGFGAGGEVFDGDTKGYGGDNVEADICTFQ